MHQGLTSGVEWLANANANYGMGIVNIVNDTQLAWRWFDSTTGGVLRVRVCGAAGAPASPPSLRTNTSLYLLPAGAVQVAQRVMWVLLTSLSIPQVLSWTRLY